MRRRLLAILSLSCLLTIGSGCRQTTSGISSSPLTPISPLTPSNSLFPAPGSNVGPMGGSTRVPPPSTGSVGTPNNYLGGATSQIGNQNGASGFAAVSPQDAFVGSGIQSAGWTETNTNLTNGSVAPAGYNEGIVQPHNRSFNQPTSITPTSIPKPLPGGMPVIDLTGIPNSPNFNFQQQQPTPPGYAPNGTPQFGYTQPGTYNLNANNNVGYGVPGSYAGANITANGTFAQPNYANTPGYDPQSNRSVSQPQFGFSGPPTNSTFQDISNQYRSQQLAPALPSTQPRNATLAPVQPTNQATENELLWRRPGSRF